MTNNLRSVWHEGELTVQKLMGTDKLMADIGPKFIREFMPLQHREFFESLTMILIGFNDHHSDIHASVLFGCAGFIQSTSESSGHALDYWVFNLILKDVIESMERSSTLARNILK